ncbi:HAMP domain-containing protein [bacterium]|nr:HAMP domain-containing protein [bacterium]
MGSWRTWGAVTHSLGWRLVITLTGSLLLLLGASGWLALQLHRQHLYSLLERTAVELGETILSSTRSSMMENDRHHLDEIIRNIGSRESVLALRLVNAGGEVEYSNHPEDVGRIHAIDSPVCQGCHFGETVRVPVNLREGLRRVPTADGGAALALGFPVLNSPGCSAAACHVHPAEQQVLGILDLELSTAPLEGAISDAASQMLAFGIITVVVVAAVIALVGWRMVHRPIRRMLAGVRRLSTGDLSTRLAVEGPTEIKGLAMSVNLMSQKLETASNELEDWNRTLETRIQEKTQQLERTRDQMVFAEKMSSLGKLAAIVAHEINNPLAGILVYAKWLRKRVAKIAASSPDGAAAEVAQLDESLATIETETARCGDVVRNLLLFSHRGGAGFEAVEVNEMLERAVRLIRHRAEMEDVEIRFELDENLPRIQGNAAEIQQAILAILINGLEAMVDGGELRIATRPDEGGDGIVIEIADNGIGIPEHLKARIFEPFFSTKEVGNATGLGLTVVYGIVERHGGRIRVDSDGKGTTFRIFLPDQPPPYPDALPDLLRSSSLG